MTFSGSVTGSVFARNAGGVLSLGKQDRVSECTIVLNEGADGSAVQTRDGNLSIERTIVAFNDTESTVACSDGAQIRMGCCNVFGNSGGDYVGCIEDILNDGNFSADPLFCNPDANQFELTDDSPCLPENNNQCRLVGAKGVPCPLTPVVRASWGDLKRLLNDSPTPK